MGQSDLLSYGIAALVINLYIMYEIIKSATKSAKSIKLQEAQVQLLVSIALKLGVDKSDVLKDTSGLLIETVAK